MSICMNDEDIHPQLFNGITVDRGNGENDGQ